MQLCECPMTPDWPWSLPDLELGLERKWPPGMASSNEVAVHDYHSWNDMSHFTSPTLTVTETLSISKRIKSIVRENERQRSRTGFYGNVRTVKNSFSSLQTPALRYSAPSQIPLRGSMRKGLLQPWNWQFRLQLKVQSELFMNFNLFRVILHFKQLFFCFYLLFYMK